MLSTFPEFKNLDLADKKAVEYFTHRHLPYSDFNFTNLWIWDVLKTRKIAEIEGNLAVLFTDYRTNKPSLSFFGNTDPNECARDLLHLSHAMDVEPKLSFIPEETAQAIDAADLIVSEDPNNHDYIFSIADIANPDCKALKSKCRLINHFKEQYPDVIFETGTLVDPTTHEEILEILHVWGLNKERKNKEYEIEYEEIALRRLLESAADHDLILSCLRHKDKMIAFSIDEVLPQEYVLSHFIKGDIAYRGVYEYLNQKVALELLNRGGKYWNWEQDLNIEGLKQLKLSYRPTHYLKKYTVALRQ
jgi:hypothetical protein